MAEATASGAVAVQSTCSTCQHWRSIANDDDWDHPDLRDEAGTVIYDDDFDTTPAPLTWGWCGRAARFGPTRADRFYVVDGSEYMAKLGTREDFGCIEHEANS